MSQYGIGDEDTIDEIINDVDIDGVLFFSLILTAEYSCNISDWLATWKIQTLFVKFLFQDGKINYDEFVNMMTKGTVDAKMN